MAVLGSCALAFLIVLPALFAPDTFVPPVAFFAVTAIGTVGLYIAYVTPVYLRWRAGDSFETRSWTLGREVQVDQRGGGGLRRAHGHHSDACPFSSLGVPWKSDFDWSFFNYTPLVVAIVLLGAGLAWVFGMNKRYKGPIRQVEFDEGMGIVDEPAGGHLRARGARRRSGLT